MGLIVVKAKVKLIHESDLEDVESFENKGMEPPSKWVWRDIALHVDDIKMLIAYNSTKTYIEDYYGYRTLVMESFETVFRKWQENMDVEDNLTTEQEIEEIENEE